MVTTRPKGSSAQWLSRAPPSTPRQLLDCNVTSGSSFGTGRGGSRWFLPSAWTLFSNGFLAVLHKKSDPALIARFRPAMVGCFCPIFFFADHNLPTNSFRRSLVLDDSGGGGSEIFCQKRQRCSVAESTHDVLVREGPTLVYQTLDGRSTRPLSTPGTAVLRLGSYHAGRDPGLTFECVACRSIVRYRYQGSALAPCSTVNG